jgi:hypothetical protein
MTDFDFMFAMFGLLLGLAIAEVLSGFARIIKMRRKARVGWLTPLLGLVVLFDLNSFWITAWVLRDAVSLTVATQTLVLLVIGGYYLLSTLIFPDDPEQWPDFDAYYDRHNRIVLGGIILINVVLFAVSVYIATDPVLTAAIERVGPQQSTPGAMDQTADMLSILALPALVAVWLLKNRRVNGVLLGLIALTTLVQALADLA